MRSAGECLLGTASSVCRLCDRRSSHGPRSLMSGIELQHAGLQRRSPPPQQACRPLASRAVLSGVGRAALRMGRLAMLGVVFGEHDLRMLSPHPLTWLPGQNLGRSTGAALYVHDVAAATSVVAAARAKVPGVRPGGAAHRGRGAAGASRGQQIVGHVAQCAADPSCASARGRTGSAGWQRCDVADPPFHKRAAILCTGEV